jgi:hypothetical protein
MRLSLHGQYPTSDTLLSNRVHPFLAYSQCERSTYGKIWRDTDVMWVPIRIGPINPSKDFPVTPPRIAKRDELIWLCRK